MKIKIALGIFATLCAALAVFFILSDERAVLTHPKGTIAQQELELIATSYSLMLVIVIPTIIALFTFAYKYRSGNKRAQYQPDHSGGIVGELALWAAPSVIIAVLAIVLWEGAHRLDPYKPIESDASPLTIQVVAIDWKWLFIYPEQGIASVNYFQIPEKVSIRFELAADDSPMNSFWIPQLSGQIYAMGGMQTQIHMMADGTGEYTGRAAEINGAGFADMTFKVKSTGAEGFQDWVEKVKQSPFQLTDGEYEQLVKPSKKHPITLYSFVEKNLFRKIVMKYMVHQ